MTLKSVTETGTIAQTVRKLQVGMGVGMGFPPLAVEYREKKNLGSSSKSTDGHCGIHV